MNPIALIRARPDLAALFLALVAGVIASPFAVCVFGE